MASASSRIPPNAAQASYSENSHPTAPHEEQKGEEDRTLVGNAVSKSYNDTTAFTSEGRVITAKFDSPVEDNITFAHVHPKEEQIHSIEAILSRAVKLETLVFKTTNAAGALITAPCYDVMNTLRTSPGFALARSKLSNFYGIRFTAKLRITLNPQPFESGMFQIFFVPTVRTFPPIVDVSSTAILDECKLPYTTSCPNVLCNISTQSEVELSIPYTGSSPFLPLGRKEADFGCFYVQSIVPITDSTNNASCDLSVYMSLHDVVLFGATSTEFTSSTGVTSAGRSSTGAQAQMLEPPSCEADMKSGPISRIGKKLLPLLDELGLSAPLANPNPERRSVAPYANVVHSNSTKNGFKLSLLSDHSLSQNPLGIDREDEMSISHIISKPTYFNQFKWTTSSEENSVLYSYNVEPDCVLQQNKTFSFLVNAPNRLRYVANCFRFWRGTIRFYFHVVANKFHSGRLRFVFDCGASGSGVPLSDYPETFTHVVDIRDATNFVLDCPYFGIAPWRRVPHDISQTLYNYTHSDLEKSSNFYDPVSTLRVYVENQLRAPATAAASLQVVVQTCAGDDFEFAAPIAPTSVPTITYTPPNTATDAISKIKGVIQLISAPEKVPPPKVADVIAPPSRDYAKDASLANSQFALGVSAEHMKTWNEMEYQPDYVGPYAYLGAAHVEQFNLTFPNFRRYYDAFMKKKKSSTGATPQALDMVPINIVGPTPSTSTQEQPHAFTVGEKVTSVRQLIKRYQLISAGNVLKTPASLIDFTLLPYFFPKPVDEGTMSGDYLSYFLFMYRFYRGSIRFLITNADSAMGSIVKFDPSYKAEVQIDTSLVFSYRLGLYKVSSFPDQVSFNNLPVAASQPFIHDLQGGIEIEVPYYSRFTKLGVMLYDKATVLPYFQDMARDYVPSGQIFIGLAKTNTDTTFFKMYAFRAAADDFNMGYMLGPPLCRVNPTFS